MADITDKPWDGDAARYQPDEWKRATLLDTGVGARDSKDRYKLPVREPDGTLNRNALGPATAALAGARGEVQATPAQKRSAAKKLLGLYREAQEEAPASLKRIAG